MWTFGDSVGSLCLSAGPSWHHEMRDWHHEMRHGKRSNGWRDVYHNREAKGVEPFHLAARDQAALASKVGISLVEGCPGMRQATNQSGLGRIWGGVRSSKQVSDANVQQGSCRCQSMDLEG